MFVGEIGFPRREFLHDLRWWEVKSIIRGYNARHHHSWEQARLIAYNAHYCMGSKDPVPTVSEWIKFPWEQKAVAPVTQDEVKEMQDEMNAINAGMKTGDDNGNDNGGGGSNDPHGDDIEG